MPIQPEATLPTDIAGEPGAGSRVGIAESASLTPPAALFVLDCTSHH